MFDTPRRIIQTGTEALEVLHLAGKITASRHMDTGPKKKGEAQFSEYLDDLQCVAAGHDFLEVVDDAEELDADTGDQAGWQGKGRQRGDGCDQGQGAG